MSNSIKTQQFWKTFGQYMAPVPSASGEKINWINYKTTVRFFRFTVQPQMGNVIIAIELSNPDEILQAAEFEQLSDLKQEFSELCGTDWLWEKLKTNNQGKTFSSVSSTIVNVDILKDEDWPLIISFLKQRLVSLDDFWNNYNYIFQI